MSSGDRFPRDLVRAQQRVWACEAATRAFVLAGPSSPLAAWPLPRQAEYQRLRGEQEAAQRAVREHPLMAHAIADHHWTATLRALWQVARTAGDAEAGSLLAGAGVRDGVAAAAGGDARVGAGAGAGAGAVIGAGVGAGVGSAAGIGAGAALGAGAGGTGSRGRAAA